MWEEDDLGARRNPGPGFSPKIRVYFSGLPSLPSSSLLASASSECDQLQTCCTGVYFGKLLTSGSPRHAPRGDPQARRVSLGEGPLSLPLATTSTNTSSIAIL
jgi:hypothetical protein